MTFWQRKEQAQRLRAIPLEWVLPLCGAQPDRHDKRKWHAPAGVLSVTGVKFMNWNSGVGGGGAIDLVIHLNQLDFKATVDWLERHFPGASAPQPATVTSQPQLQMPSPEPVHLARIKHYLIVERGLPPVLIDSLIQSSTLYADTRANVVFLLLGNQNIPVGAELRGTTSSSWRGLAPGSQKDLGFFSIPASPLPDIILCESVKSWFKFVTFSVHPTSLYLDSCKPSSLSMKKSSSR